MWLCRNGRQLIQSALFQQPMLEVTGKSPGSLHNHSILKPQGFPRDSTNRGPLELRNVPMSLVAPVHETRGLRARRPLNSEMVRISWVNFLEANEHTPVVQPRRDLGSLSVISC